MRTLTRRLLISALTSPREGVFGGCFAMNCSLSLSSLTAERNTSPTGTFTILSTRFLEMDIFPTKRVRSRPTFFRLSMRTLKVCVYQCQQTHPPIHSSIHPPTQNKHNIHYIYTYINIYMYIYIMYMYNI